MVIIIKALEALEAWVFYCQQVFISIYSNFQLVIIIIALDKILFSIKKYGYFSHFSMKTYDVVIIRSASARHF